MWKIYANKFADKTETKVGFKHANSQIRELYSMFVSLPKQLDKTESEPDNALFSKKPLGGFSCAS